MFQYLKTRHYLKHHVYKSCKIIMNKKPNKIHQNMIPTKINNHTVQYQLLHNNKQHKHML